MTNLAYRTNQQLNVCLEKVYTIWKVDVDKNYINSPNGRGGNFYVALRTISGEGIIKTKKETFIAEKNTILFFQFSEIIQYYCSGDRWNFYWFEFDTRDISVVPLYQLRNIDFSSWEMMLMNECLAYITLPDANMNQYGMSIFSTLLQMWLFMLYSSSESYENDIILKSMSIIRDNLNRSISVSDLSDRLNISERTLRNLFNKNVGMSPKKYIKDYKLHIAKELLETTSFQIKEIAVLTGYLNQYYFSKDFKSAFGVPPSGIRSGI